MALQDPVQPSPVGSIVAFAGPRDNLPRNWRVCDGAAFTRRDYPELADRIGATWGGDAAGTMYLPNLAGYFLRGVEEPGGGNLDPDGDARTVARPELANQGNHGRYVGSVQKDELRSHGHGVNDPGHVHDCRWGNMIGAGSHGYERSHIEGGAPFPQAMTNTTGITIAASGGSETRPANAYVYWVIRVN